MDGKIRLQKNIQITAERAKMDGKYITRRIKRLLDI